MTQTKRPAPPQNRPSPNANGSSEYIGLPGYEPREPLTAEDRADFDVLVAAHERGYRLAVQCTRCGQWLVALKSVATHMGPVCRAKVVTR